MRITHSTCLARGVRGTRVRKKRSFETLRTHSKDADGTKDPSRYRFVGQEIPRSHTEASGNPYCRRDRLGPEPVGFPIAFADPAGRRGPNAHRNQGNTGMEG